MAELINETKNTIRITFPGGPNSDFIEFSVSKRSDGTKVNRWVFNASLEDTGETELAESDMRELLSWLIAALDVSSNA